jgi:hypothetical protein
VTPDELERLILQTKDQAALQRAFANLDIAQRKKLSSTAQKLYNQISRNKPNKDASDRLRKFIEKQKRNHWNSRPSRNAGLALFALGPLSAVKKRDLFIDWGDKEIFGQIVLDRAPDWLDDWIAYDLEQEFRILEFPILRLWIKNGVCRKPEVDGYTEMFAAHMSAPRDRKNQPRPPLSRQLQNEPDLLDDVWRIFQVENIAFDGHAWLTADAAHDYETWPVAMGKLADSGHLDRQRLLDASLHGLSTDVKQTQLSGFHKFHKFLKPTKEDRNQRQSAYLDLLTHKVGHVCKFGLSMLGQIEKDGSLDADTFLSEVSAIFIQEAKGNAVAALKLVNRILKKQPNHADKALGAVIEALQHPRADVQELAMDILAGHQDALSETLQEAMRAKSDFLASFNKGELATLLNQETRPEPADSEYHLEAVQEIDNLLTNIPAAQKKALGIDAILAKERFEYCPISPHIMDHRILPTVESLAPVETVDELIALVSHAVEIVESPDTVERIIDGISRLCHDRSNDFKAKSAPLRHRLEQGGFEGSKGIFQAGGVQYTLLDLLMSWLTGKHYQTSLGEYMHQEACLEPLVAHLRSIIKRVAAGRPAPLLSTPTHNGGWIDPLVWVQRIQSSERNGIRHEALDLCFSLLRLMPDNRTPALEEARKLRGEWKRPVCFALGGEEQLSIRDRKQYDLWISAARARDPHGDWSGFLAPLKLLDPWPDSSEPARYCWRAYVRESRPYPNQVYKIPHLEIRVETASQSNPSKPPETLVGKLRHTLASVVQTDRKRLPTAAIHKQTRTKPYWAGDLNQIWTTQWLSHLWPLCPSGVYAIGARALVSRIDENSSNWTPGLGHLSGLFQKKRPWGEMGHLVLCLGLAGKDADCRGLAIDALIEGVDSGQLAPDQFASVLADLASGKWLKLNRLGDNLIQVIQTSPLHAWVISDCLQLWLSDADLKQRNLFRILEVLLEAHAILDRNLDQDVRARLETIKGSSKAAKIAKKLIEIRNEKALLHDELKQLAITARVEVV